MTELYRTLSRLKKVNPEIYDGIKGGDLVRLDENLDGKVIAFIREVEPNHILACFNLSGEEKTIELDGEFFRDIHGRVLREEADP